MGQQGGVYCILQDNKWHADAGYHRTRFASGWCKGGVTMNIPNESALDAITECFCKIYRANEDLGCSECPLHAIKVEYHASICSLYDSDYDKDRIALLQACIKHGNAEVFKDLSPEYRQFVIRKATVV